MTTMYSWGGGSHGQLGHGSKEDSSKPKQVSQPLTVVGCAHFHSIGLTAKGETYSWGRGALGLLGHGDEEGCDAPKRIDALADTKVVAIGCGAYHSAAVTQEGTVLTWGWTLLWADGRVEESYFLRPAPMSGLDKIHVSGVACGCYATAAWSADGKVFTWGRGSTGQLGHGSVDDELMPRQVKAMGGTSVVQAAMGGMQGNAFMLLRTTDGRVYSCGAMDRGRLGRAAVSTPAPGAPAVGDVPPHSLPGPVVLGGATDGGPLAAFAVAVAAADHHAAAVGQTGLLFTWGSNEFGRLGLPGVEQANAPKLVEALSDVKVVGVACSAYSTAVAVGNGTVFTMGGRLHGTPTPKPLTLPDVAASVTGGGYHLAALVGTPPAALKPGTATLGTAAELPEVLRGVVSDELVELLLADCKGAPALQLRHEIHLLRELLAAEQRKLDALSPEALQHAQAKLSSSAGLRPGVSDASDAWTEQQYQAFARKTAVGDHAFGKVVYA